MANLDFYALEDDLRDLIRFLYTETDVVIFELASEFDRDIRQFRTLSELEAVFHLGTCRAGHLQLWSPTVMKQPVIQRIELTRVPGHSFRYEARGAGLIQLYLDGSKDGVIYHTHYGHWNKAGAYERSIYPADDCDWDQLTKVSGRIQRYIQGKLAAAKLYARPILRHAFNAVEEGQGLWWGPDIKHAGSSDIKAIR